MINNRSISPLPGTAGYPAATVPATTLLSTLAGLRQPAGGAVLLDGEDAHLMPPRETALRRAWLGQFMNDPSVRRRNLTAATHLGRWDWETPNDARLARSALAAVGLDGMEKRQIHTLSGAANWSATGHRRTLLAQGAAGTCSTNCLHPRPQSPDGRPRALQSALPAIAARGSSWFCTIRRSPTASATAPC